MAISDRFMVVFRLQIEEPKHVMSWILPHCSKLTHHLVMRYVLSLIWA